MINEICFAVINNGNLAGNEEFIFLEYDNRIIRCMKPRIEFCGPQTDFLDILVRFNFFRSKSEARRAGWMREVPVGWNDWRIGKLKRTLSILNPI